MMASYKIHLLNDLGSSLWGKMTWRCTLSKRTRACVHACVCVCVHENNSWPPYYHCASFFLQYGCLLSIFKNKKKKKTRNSKRPEKQNRDWKIPLFPFKIFLIFVPCLFSFSLSFVFVFCFFFKMLTPDKNKWHHVKFRHLRLNKSLN